MDDLLADLAVGGFPTSPLNRCMGQYPDIAPRLRDLLERAAFGAALGHAERAQLFYGLHILGTGRDPRSCRALLRLLRRDPDDLDGLLGDALHQTLPRILIGVFDGHPEGYFDLAMDGTVDGQVRQAALGAIAFLTWEGRIEREQAIRFLDRFDRERSGGTDPAVWAAWQRAIALLGLRGLAPQVEAARRDGRLTEEDDFPALLDQAEKAPQEACRFVERKLGYILDLVAALEWVAENRLDLSVDQTVADAPAGFRAGVVYDDFDDDFDDDLDGLGEPATQPANLSAQGLG